jgi:hypothetical protein
MDKENSEVSSAIWLPPLWAGFFVPPQEVGLLSPAGLSVAPVAERLLYSGRRHSNAVTNSVAGCGEACQSSCGVECESSCGEERESSCGVAGESSCGVKRESSEACESSCAHNWHRSHSRPSGCGIWQT